MLQIVPNYTIGQSLEKTDLSFQIDSLEKKLLECHIFSNNIIDILVAYERKVQNGEALEADLLKAIEELTALSEDQNKSIEDKNKQIAKLAKKLNRKSKMVWVSAATGFVGGVAITVGIISLAK